jgi:hypothetical protein
MTGVGDKTGRLRKWIFTERLIGGVLSWRWFVNELLSSSTYMRNRVTPTDGERMALHGAFFGIMTMDSSYFWLLAVIVVSLIGCGHPSELQAPSAQAKTDLPEISNFLAKPSDRFLVDMEEVSRGLPFLGVNSPHPHACGHVHFDNTKKRWPKGKDEPSNYPAIYAVAGGVVSRVDTRFGLPGGNDRYGLDLIFATDKTGSQCRFCYSIEPMCPEPTEGSPARRSCRTPAHGLGGAEGSRRGWCRRT